MRIPRYTPPRKYLLIGTVVFFALATTGYLLNRDAQHRYETLRSVVVYDRHHIPIVVNANEKNQYELESDTLPNGFVDLLLRKEDRYFYYHLGINPLSAARAFFSYLRTGKSDGSSTLTEQLAKNLLSNENNRSMLHKLTEMAYAVSMELFLSKHTILTMYMNTVYLGNQVQGFETGSRTYFGKPLSETTPYEQVILLATLSYPASRNPWKEDNGTYARALYASLGGTGDFVAPLIQKKFNLQNPTMFELNSMHITCTALCMTTLDASLTNHVRTILERTIEHEYARGVRNGAVVIIDPRTEELLAVVGSPDPSKTDDGGQINMAIQPRPIGSTVKPFIYLKGFMEGLRPYTLVDDREYRYPIATGYALYPKNYDGAYHGEITLHTALSNSINVPSVKVLEYIGLPKFYTFLENTLAFTPIRPLDSYQYGIALGGLEVDLLTLSHYFTLFPRGGTLAPLRVIQNNATPYLPPQSHIKEITTVAPTEYTELVTKILSDRLTGVEQFGLKSSLNLSTANYALKTGTSRDFHDSWVVGYTPDFVVGVWLGNSENEPLAQVSGQSGAGSVWHDVMEYLLASPYTSGKTFTLDDLQSFSIKDSLEWGLPGDLVDEHRTLLIDNRLITSIHEGDLFEYIDNMGIPLRAKESVTWMENGSRIGTGDAVNWRPKTPGTYEIEADAGDAAHREIVTVTIQSASN